MEWVSKLVMLLVLLVEMWVVKKVVWKVEMMVV
jgi:hypothetical protein